MMKKVTYTRAGVDIKKADVFIKKIGGRKRSTLKAFGSFFELMPLLRRYQDPCLVSSADGVGTKLKIAQEAGIHDTVGVDLVAMNVNDIICLGAKPLFFLDYIACGSLDVPVLLKVVRGIKRGLAQSDCALTGGETAEMPGMYKKGEYDLAGFCVGIVERRRIIDGSKIRQGDLIIGLPSSGLHSNGFSLVRKALGRAGCVRHARELLVPTKIYVKPVLSLIERMKNAKDAVRGIAHVTGGAFYNKATKILPRGLGMRIDTRCWRIPLIFSSIQKKAHLDREQMYSVFNMGIGLMIVVSKKSAHRAQRILAQYSRPRVIGEIVSSRKQMVLL